MLCCNYSSSDRSSWCRIVDTPDVVPPVSIATTGTDTHTDENEKDNDHPGGEGESSEGGRERGGVEFTEPLQKAISFHTSIQNVRVAVCSMDTTIYVAYRNRTKLS